MHEPRNPQSTQPSQVPANPEPVPSWDPSTVRPLDSDHGPLPPPPPGQAPPLALDVGAAGPKLAADPVAAGPPTVPGYEVLEVLGRGGMGVVYKARQVTLDRLVALKVILAGPHASAEDVARFRREAEAVARLQHPNIVQIHEVGEHHGLPYFSLEYCDGGNLAAKANGTPLPARHAAQIAETLARAMHAAHQRGIIHRDLKPANVLLVRSDSIHGVALGSGPDQSGRYQPKITDFGLAKRLDDTARHTGTGAILGTPSYMAPEQAGVKGQAVGPAADVYALGALLYELLTGRPPFKAETPLDTVLQVLHEEPVPPSQLNPKVPRDLETVCLKCLQKEPRKRFATAHDLAGDLRCFLAGEPIRARSVGRLEKAGKWVQRNPLVAALVAAVVLVLLAGTAVSTWQAVRATLAQQTANAERDKTIDQTRRANENLDIANAVDDFMTNDLLYQAAPDKTTNRNVTLRTVLDRAAKKIDGRFPDKPLVEASVRRTVGGVYWSLGDYTEAERHLLRARQLYVKTRGVDDPRTLLTNGVLANVNRGQLKLEESRRLHEDVLRRQRRVLGPEHKETLDSMNDLAVVLVDLHKLPEARQLHEQVLRVRRRVFGPEHAYTLVSMANLAVVLAAEHKGAEARKLNQEILQIRQRTLGRKHPHTLLSKSNLGLDLFNTGEYEAARKLLEETLPLQQSVMGRKHPLTLSTMACLATTLHALNRKKEALQLYEETLALQRQALAPQHPDRLVLTNGLAWLLATSPDAKVRDPVRAVQLAKEVVRYAPRQSYFCTTLGVAYYHAGHYKNAVAALEKSEELGPGPLLAHNGFFLAMASWQLGEKDKAQKWYARAAGWMQKNHPTNWELQQYRAEAARVLGVSRTAPANGK